MSSRAVDVQLEHLRRAGQLPGGALGHPPGAPEARQDHLGAELLGARGGREGDRMAVEHAGDEDAPSLEHHSGSGMNSPGATPAVDLLVP